MSTEKLPRNSNLPVPPYSKPPRGYDPIPGEEIETRLSNASHDELVRLLVKGWNAGAFTLYERSATGGESPEGGSNLDGGDDTYNIDEIVGWPPPPTGEEDD